MKLKNKLFKVSLMIIFILFSFLITRHVYFYALVFKNAEAAGAFIENDHYIPSETLVIENNDAEYNLLIEELYMEEEKMEWLSNEYCLIINFDVECIDGDNEVYIDYSLYSYIEHHVESIQLIDGNNRAFFGLNSSDVYDFYKNKNIENSFDLYSYAVKTSYQDISFFSSIKDKKEVIINNLIGHNILYYYYDYTILIEDDIQAMIGFSEEHTQIIIFGSGTNYFFYFPNGLDEDDALELISSIRIIEEEV